MQLLPLVLVINRKAKDKRVVPFRFGLLSLWLLLQLDWKIFR